MHFKLISLLVFLIVLSNTGYNFYGEFSVLELLQASILFLCLLILLRNKDSFLKYSNKLSFSIKCFLFVVLLYEELSFLTTDLSSLFNLINNQSEINIHNAKIFTKLFVYFEIPLLNYSATIGLYVFVQFLALFILAYGSYVPILKKLKFVFLEQKYAFYSFVYILPLIFNSFNNKLLDTGFLPTLHPEFAELFIYAVLLSDIILKKQKM